MKRKKNNRFLSNLTLFCPNSRPDPKRGQALTEYALLMAVTVFSLVVVNKLLIGVISRALRRVVEIVSLPFP